MIIKKSFDCTIKDLDSVVVALAKEIEDGWTIERVQHHAPTMCVGEAIREPQFTFHFVDVT